MANVRNGVVLSMGLVTATVDVMTAVRENKETGLRNVCCGSDDAPHDPTPVKQQYSCITCKATGPATDFGKAKEVSKNNFVPITDEEREELLAIPESLKTQLVISSYPADELAGLLPVAKPYLLQPQPAFVKTYAVMRETIKQASDRVFATLWAARGAPTMVRLIVVGDHLAILPLCWPSEVAAAAEVPDVEISDKERAMLAGFAAAMEAEFDPAQFTDMRADAMASYIAENAPVEGVVVPLEKNAKPAAADDLMAKLQASIDAAKPKKVTKKATARRKSA